MRTSTMLQALRANDVRANEAKVFEAGLVAQSRGWTSEQVDRFVGSDTVRVYLQARFVFAAPKPATGKAQGYVARLIRGY